MSNEHFPTRRDVLSGALGLAAGTLYPWGLHAFGHAATQSNNQPYRYAGGRWWDGDFTLGGINPGHGGWNRDRNEWTTQPEPGFRTYHSVKYIENHLADEPTDPARLLNQRYVDLTSDNPVLQESLEIFNRWAQDMTAWARAVRKDLLALEQTIGQKGGDPGDPPPVPWK